MSLKAFHVLFITAASALAFGLGVWMLRAYRSQRQGRETFQQFTTRLDIGKLQELFAG